MNYQAIVKDDLINGEGIRCTLFVSGCSHGCNGCYNEKAWDYRSGVPFGTEQLDIIRQELSKYYVQGLTLLGGDPLAPKNFSTVLDLCKMVKEEFPDKDIWCWSGYVLDEIINNHAAPVLEYIDVLVDGKFVQELKDMSLPYRGSSNQRILHKGVDF